MQECDIKCTVTISVLPQWCLMCKFHLWWQEWYVIIFITATVATTIAIITITIITTNTNTTTVYTATNVTTTVTTRFTERIQKPQGKRERQVPLRMKWAENFWGLDISFAKLMLVYFMRPHKDLEALAVIRPLGPWGPGEICPPPCPLLGCPGHYHYHCFNLYFARFYTKTALYPSIRWSL